MEKKRSNNEQAHGDSKRICIDNETQMSGDEEEDKFNCSQRPDFRPPAQLNEAECGIIEKVTLQNFMCHSNLSVNLGPNVNFIIGRNGSGKSAIMTAIVVGLGGKALTTNRGSSLKGYVKDKCSTAVIKIQLKNSGHDAFKPNKYGSSIIVERKISSNGTGSYKIMAGNGSVISTGKDELNHILDQFNIQIHNPLFISNQDTSRNFLCAAKAEENYQFFLKATQLEQMSNDYLTIKERREIIKNTLEKKKENIPEMEKEVQQLEEKYKDLEQLKVLEGRIEELTKEIAWAQVIEKEKSQSNSLEIKSHRKHYREKMKEILEKISKMEAELEMLKKEAEEAIKLASEYCQRVATRRSVKSLESEILQTERRAEQQSRGQIEVCCADRSEFVEAKERLNTVVTNMRSLEKLNNRLGELLKQRVTNYAYYRRFIALRAENNFGMMLCQYGYTGKMTLDHEKEQLHLQVNVDQAQKSGNNNSKSLSGEERSFSTISFIMALWDAMEAPFRCLDEFDVFMDMVNRRISMEMMMKIGREQKHRQFIFFTPQDVSNVGGGEDVKIFRLQDPERGQTTLPLQPVER